MSPLFLKILLPDIGDRFSDFCHPTAFWTLVSAEKMAVNLIEDLLQEISYFSPAFKTLCLWIWIV